MDAFETILFTIRQSQEKIEKRLENIQKEVEKARQKQQEIQEEQKRIMEKQNEMQIIMDKKDNRTRAILKRIEGAKNEH